MFFFIFFKTDFFVFFIKNLYQDTTLILNKKVGDYIEDGETLLTLYTNNKDSISEAIAVCMNATRIKDMPAAESKLIYEIIK